MPGFFMPKDKVLDDDDFIDLPDGVMTLDPEVEVDDDAGLPFQLFDDEAEEEVEDKPNGKDKDDEAEEEDEDEPLAADAERESLVSQLSELQSRLAERDEEHNKTSSESRKHISTMADITLESLNAREESLADRLKRAREDGETGDEIAIQRQIEQLGTIRKSIETVKANAEKEPEPKAEASSGASDSAGGIKGRNEYANRWQAQNAAWMGSPKNRAKVSYLRGLSEELASEGISPNSEGHFKELTRRMAKTFPDLAIRHIDGKAPATGQRQRGSGKGSPVAGAKQSNGAPSKKDGKVTITTEDLRMMRTLKMDTSNKDVLKEYAKNKANTSPYMR